MAQQVKSFGRQIVLWTAAGVGFNIAQRLRDHFIDSAVAGHPWLAWLN